jgi:hypothetical protein
MMQAPALCIRSPEIQPQQRAFTAGSDLEFEALVWLPLIPLMLMLHHTWAIQM